MNTREKWTNLTQCELKTIKMGWFSSDELVNIENSAHDTAQTVALSVLAFIALTYGVLKIFNAHNRHQSEQAANAVVRLQTMSSV